MMRVSRVLKSFSLSIAVPNYASHFAIAHQNYLSKSTKIQHGRFNHRAFIEIVTNVSLKANSPSLRLLSSLTTWKEIQYFWPLSIEKLDHFSELTMMPWSLSDELCRLLSGPLGLGASSKVWKAFIMIIG